MTIPQAAALLGLSPQTLRVQVRNGKLHATKVGRDWSVTPREVERYRAEHLGRAGRPVRSGRIVAAVVASAQETGPATHE